MTNKTTAAHKQPTTETPWQQNKIKTSTTVDSCNKGTDAKQSEGSKLKGKWTVSQVQAVSTCATTEWKTWESVWIANASKNEKQRVASKPPAKRVRICRNAICGEVLVNSAKCDFFHNVWNCKSCTLSPLSLRPNHFQITSLSPSSSDQCLSYSKEQRNQCSSQPSSELLQNKTFLNQKHCEGMGESLGCCLAGRGWMVMLENKTERWGCERATWDDSWKSQRSGKTRIQKEITAKVTCKYWFLR